MVCGIIRVDGVWDHTCGWCLGSYVWMVCADYDQLSVSDTSCPGASVMRALSGLWVRVVSSSSGPDVDPGDLALCKLSQPGWQDEIDAWQHAITHEPLCLHADDLRKP